MAFIDNNLLMILVDKAIHALCEELTVTSFAIPQDTPCSVYVCGGGTVALFVYYGLTPLGNIHVLYSSLIGTLSTQKM